MKKISYIFALVSLLLLASCGQKAAPVNIGGDATPVQNTPVGTMTGAAPTVVVPPSPPQTIVVKPVEAAPVPEKITPVNESATTSNTPIVVTPPAPVTPTPVVKAPPVLEVKKDPTPKAETPVQILNKTPAPVDDVKPKK